MPTPSFPLEGCSLRGFLLPLFALISAPDLFPQCCCTNIVLEVTLDNVVDLRSDRDFEVKETRGQYTFTSVDKDSTDRRLSLLLDAGCGLMERRLLITRRATGERMELSVLFVGFDGWHPGLRVPFRSGTYDLDLERMIGCAGLDQGWDRSAAAALAPSVSLVSCGSGSLRVHRDAEGAMLEPLDLETQAFRPGHVACDAPRFACFPDGPLLLSQRTGSAADQRGGAERTARMVTGFGHVSATGYSHVRMDTEQTERIHNVEMAMMGELGWRAAWVPDASAPDGRRAIASMMRFSLDLSR